MEYPSGDIGRGLDEEGITDRYMAAAYGFGVAKEQALAIICSHMGSDVWIPCSEGLPEEKTNPITKDFYEYQVTFKSEDVTDIRHYKFGEGHWWHGGGIMDKYVTAWRPLPEPYSPAQKAVGDDYKNRIMDRFLKVE